MSNTQTGNIFAAFLSPWHCCSICFSFTFVAYSSVQKRNTLAGVFQAASIVCRLLSRTPAAFLQYFTSFFFRHKHRAHRPKAANCIHCSFTRAKSIFSRVLKAALGWKRRPFRCRTAYKKTLFLKSCQYAWQERAFMIDLLRLRAEAATRFLLKKRSFTFQFMLVIPCADVIEDILSAKKGMTKHFQISAYFFHNAFIRHYRRSCNRCSFVMVRTFAAIRGPHKSAAS